MSTFPIHRGNLIISANNNSRWDFWTNNETQRLVLANPLNDTVPLAVRESNVEHFSYEHVLTNDLVKYLALTRHRIVKDYTLPGSDEKKAENLMRLWELPNFIEDASNKPLKLKEGMFLLSFFNTGGYIKEIYIPETVEQVQDTFESLFNLDADPIVSYAMLHVEDSELKIFTQKNMPTEFYSHVDSFNDLISTMEALLPTKEISTPKETKV